MAQCSHCERPTFFQNAYASFHCRVCGFACGTHGDDHLEWEDRTFPFWNRACEKVQWHGNRKAAIIKDELPTYRHWLKFYSERWLIGGSTRSELEADERAVWLDFLCLANRLDGHFEIFSRDLLANQLRISRELLDRSIKNFLVHKKVKIGAKKRNNNVEKFFVNNWKRYQYGEGDRVVKSPKRKDNTTSGEKD
jgi:hypothetical protein